MNYENDYIKDLPVDILCEIPGGNAIKLNSNENPYSPAPEVLDCLKIEDDRLLRYYPDVNYLGLKNKIADYYNKKVKFDNFQLDADNIFLANGSDQVLAMIFETFFKDSKQPILLPEITYCYDIWAQLCNTKYKTIQNCSNYEIDIEKLKEKSAKGVVFANPNTTGLTLTTEKIREIVQFYSGRAIVVVDEAYIEFSSQPSAVKLVEEFDNLIVVSTFSKAFSLAGGRIGFAISSKNNISALVKLKSAYSLVLISGLTTIMAEKTIENIGYYHKNIEKIKENRQIFTDFLVKNANFEFIPSDASFVFVRHKKMSASDLYLFLKQNNIYVRPYEHGKLNGFVRITIGTSGQMKKVINVLEKL